MIRTDPTENEMRSIPGADRLKETIMMRDFSLMRGQADEGQEDRRKMTLRIPTLTCTYLHPNDEPDLTRSSQHN
mgnify:CR=1 FL=1